MKVTCTDESGNVYSTELDPNTLVEDLSVLTEVEFGIPVQAQLLIAPNGTILHVNETFRAQGITSDCRITVKREASSVGSRRAVESWSAGRTEVPLEEEQSHILELLAGGAAPVRYGSELQVSQMFDETDPAVQSSIYEEIEKRNVEENLANALEFSPEMFTRVSMLYVTVEINKEKVRALVDCGAQVSVVSAITARRCGLMWLVDKRMAGTFRGVGEQRSLGRIHFAQVNLGGLFIPISLSVLESETFDLIIGLDQMKKHCMIVDLKDRCLRVSDVAIPFLSDSELPAESREGPVLIMADGTDRGATAVASATSQGSAAAGGGVPCSSAISVDEKEQTIETLVSLTHMEREQAVALLEASGWDPNAALSLLMEE